jgi:thioesterase domain-containing protein
MDFVKEYCHLNPAPVYVLDDRVLLHHEPFTFSSIEDVAADCLPHLQNIIDYYYNLRERKVTIKLMGWSYGGVVASEVAKLLTRVSFYEKFHLEFLVLFDSPFRECVTDETPQDIMTDTSSGANNQTDLKNLMQRSQRHFECCNILLRDFFIRPQDNQPLSCPIIYFKPKQNVFHNNGIEMTVLKDLENLTNSTVSMHRVEGNHWTMLFKEHVHEVVTILHSESMKKQ